MKTPTQLLEKKTLYSSAVAVEVCIYQCLFFCFFYFFQSRNATYPPEHTCTARSQLKTQGREEGGEERGEMHSALFLEQK